MEFLIEPWEHQRKAIEIAKDLHPGYALFFEQGTGKTGTAINILRHKFNTRQRIMRTLILCPIIATKNWKDEWRKHSKIDPRLITILDGSGKKRQETMKKFGWGRLNAATPLAPVPRIFITNHESLNMSELHKLFMQWEPEILVLDESHRFKNPKARRTKAVDKLANPKDAAKPFTYLLTGTPMLNTPMDIWQQFKILDGGAALGDNFYAFQRRFFVDRNARMPRHKYFPKWEVKEKDKDGVDGLGEINKRIRPLSMRRKKEDCLDLPPLVYQTVRVPMTPTQRRHYEQLKKDFITYMKGDAVTAPLAVTKALRLMQISSGFANTEDGRTVALDDTPKDKALKELLEDLTPDNKVIVWAVWKENYVRIRKILEGLGIGYTEIHGEIPPHKKHDNARHFGDDPSCRVLLGHPGSAGIAINLVAASYSIFYSRTFSLEQSLQAEARNHRGGSEIHDKITRIDLVCENSIDETVTEKLQGKIEISEKVLRDLAGEI